LLITDPLVAEMVEMPLCPGLHVARPELNGGTKLALEDDQDTLDVMSLVLWFT
jgi:hypothetical protein